MNAFLLHFVQVLLYVLQIAIFARVILSWFPTFGNNPIVAAIYQITEPLLAPLRRVIPSLGFLDLSPMVALILLSIVQVIVTRAL